MNNSSTAARTGLVVLGLLSIADIATLALTDGEHPPYAVAVLSALLGVASLVLLFRAWRDAARGVAMLVILRVVSAATALPAFFVSDVPSPARVAAGAIVVLTALAIVLLAAGRQESAQQLADVR